MGQAAVVVDKVGLTLEVKDCHVVGVACGRGLHEDAAKLPLIGHNVIGGGVGHLLPPVGGKEHVIGAKIVAILILLPVVVGGLGVAVALKLVLVVEDLDAVHLADDNVVGGAVLRVVAHREVVGVAVPVQDGDHILVELTDEEAVVAPA